MFGEGDARTPVFFLSYARPSRRIRTSGTSDGPSVERFFGDLSESVGQLVSRVVGDDPGYMDASIQDGSDWRDELLDAVGCCQVFVALVNRSYTESDWCAMEWDAFSRRPVRKIGKSGSDRQKAILPVVWAPVSRRGLPAPIKAVQFFSPDGLPDPGVPREYLNEGVFGLMRMERTAAYYAVVWRLAQRIADIYHNHHVESRIFERSELRDIFRGEVHGRER